MLVRGKIRGMSDDRPWYREPETFIALAALIVSITAVVVGVYEAALQRKHDVAEVWPHLELSTWLSDTTATFRIGNTGLGPAIVNFVEVRVDGKAQRNWQEALRTLYGHEPPPHSYATTVGQALRPGDRMVLVDFPTAGLRQEFWSWVNRVSVRVCYKSVFDQYWYVTDTLGKSDVWMDVDRCPPQPRNTDF
jgi:hypothetical protein